MAINDNQHITVSNPTSLSELFQFLSREPNAIFYAGGSWLSSHQQDQILNLGKNIINLQSLPELKKIDRNERYIDFGACVSLSRIDNLRSQIIPDILHFAINKIANPQIRNLATIGGNIAISPMRMSLYPALLALDSKLEIRSLSKSRWVELRNFVDDNNKIDLQQGELITKIRIPIQPWNFHKYNFIGKRTNFQKDFSILATVANIDKAMVSDMKMIILDSTTTLVKPVETEGNIIGKNIPLSKIAKNELLDVFNREISHHADHLCADAKERFQRLFKQLLSELT